MKKKIAFLILPISFFFFSWSFFLAFAAPMPTGIAINEKTNECGKYSGGDERVHFDLKKNWEAYYPIRKIEFVTDYGKCIIKEHSSASECCSQLGLRYINYSSIPFNDKEKFGNSVCILPFHTDGVEYYDGISINQNTKECTELLQYRLEVIDDPLNNWKTDYDKICLIDKNWKDFRKVNFISKVYETPKGTCEILYSSTNDNNEK